MCDEFFSYPLVYLRVGFFGPVTGPWSLVSETLIHDARKALDWAAGQYPSDPDGSGLLTGCEPNDA